MLALNGDAPITNTPFPVWPQFNEEMIAVSADILRSGKVNYWTGEQGKLFESEFAAYVGTKYAVALANGTVALELALYSLGVGAGDEVITTPRTFIASASAAVMRGAVPVMADVDPDSQNITAETISRVITPRTKAIIVVHLAGWPANMTEIMDLANSRGIFVIEDVAQAHGAMLNGLKTGALSHVSAFSFCQDKIMTTAGEGGMLCTNDREIWKRAWAFKDHGKNYDVVFNTKHPPGFRWLHESFGTNWRLTEIQSAVGRVALSCIESWIEHRRSAAEKISRTLKQFKAIRVPEPGSKIYHSYYRLYAFVNPGELKADWGRDEVMAAINAEGVPCLSGSCSEIYLEKAFDGLGPKSRLPVAKELGETSLAFRVDPALGSEEIEYTCKAIDRVLSYASK